MNTCFAYCLSNNFKFNELIDYLDSRYRMIRYKDVVHIEKTSGEVFLFPYGVIVSWGMGHDELQMLLAETRPFQAETHDTPIIDELTYSAGGEKFKIHDDHVTLVVEDALDKLAISHAVAQSVKLTELETNAENTIVETAYIPKRMAQYGRTDLSRREISKMRGELYLVKSNIYLHFDLLDTPEFFWEYPEFQDIYNTVANYLEVSPRVEILNKKLGIIQELFNMLSDEQKHKHSSTLEWIIIWLIAIEIVIFLIHDIFNLI